METHQFGNYVDENLDHSLLKHIHYTLSTARCFNGDSEHTM